MSEKLSSLGVNFNTVYTAAWDSFVRAFLLTITLLEKETQLVSKAITAGYITAFAEHSEKFAVSPKTV